MDFDTLRSFVGRKPHSSAQAPDSPKPTADDPHLLTTPSEQGDIMSENPDTPAPAGADQSAEDQSARYAKALDADACKGQLNLALFLLKTTDMSADDVSAACGLVALTKQDPALSTDADAKDAAEAKYLAQMQAEGNPPLAPFTPKEQTDSKYGKAKSWAKIYGTEGNA
ncbi:MAG: hypothetical protein AAGA36_00250 [Pseudomonadota bacterium]